MQSRYEAAAVNLAAARCAVAEPDDVGAGLAQSGGKGELLGVVGERDKPGLAVAIIAHEYCELAAWGQDTGAIANERAVGFKECRQRGRARQVPRIRRVNFLPPVGGMRPNKIEHGQATEALGVGGVKAVANVP